MALRAAGGDGKDLPMENLVLYGFMRLKTYRLKKYDLTYCYLTIKKNHGGKTMPCLPSPVISIFIGGMFTIPKWVVYDIVYPHYKVFWDLLHLPCFMMFH